MNFVAGQVVPNLVLAKLGTDGKVTIRNVSPGTTEVVADVAGYFMAGTVVDPGGVCAVDPMRLLDTRTMYGGSGAVAANSSIPVTFSVVRCSGDRCLRRRRQHHGRVPGSVRLPHRPPDRPALPNASNVNFVAGQVPNWRS